MIPLMRNVRNFGNLLNWGDDAAEGSNIKTEIYANEYEAFNARVQIALVFDIDRGPLNGLEAVLGRDNVGIIYNNNENFPLEDKTVEMDKYFSIYQASDLGGIDYLVAPVFISNNTKVELKALEAYPGAIFIVQNSGKIELYKPGRLIDIHLFSGGESIKDGYQVFDKAEIAKMPDKKIAVTLTRYTYFPEGI